MVLSIVKAATADVDVSEECVRHPNILDQHGMTLDSHLAAAAAAGSNGQIIRMVLAHALTDLMACSLGCHAATHKYSTQYGAHYLVHPVLSQHKAQHDC